MKFFFCETCGKRLTDADLESGQARNKQVKGIYCKDCAANVMTMSFEAMSEAQARAYLKKDSAVSVAPAGPSQPRRDSNAKVAPAMRRPATRAEAGLRSQDGLWLVGLLAAAVCLVGALLVLKKPAGEPLAETPLASKSAAPAANKTGAAQAQPQPSNTIEPAKKQTPPPTSIKTVESKTEPPQMPEPAVKSEDGISTPPEVKSGNKPDTEEEDLEAKTGESPTKHVDMKDLAKADPPAALPDDVKKLEAQVPKVGLGCWLRSDAGVMLTGDGVCEWKDQSGKGNHAAMTLTSGQPTYVPNVLLGLPAIRFNGKKDRIYIRAAPAKGREARVYFIVIHDAQRTGAAYEGVWSSGVQRKLQGYSLNLSFDNREFLHMTYHDGSMQSTQPCVRDTMVVTSFYDGKIDRLYINGVENVSRAVDLDTSPTAIRLGTTLRGQSDCYKGDLFEFLAYGAALNPEERQCVEKYLMLKYGVTSRKP